MVEFKYKDSYNIDDLIEIVQLLRSNDGCPWDKVQTHSSIKKDFIEEVYEAIEAINLGNTELLREELGDVLLQVVFHCQIETEQSHFYFDDICDEVCKKLIIRHPHVFADTIADTPEKVLENWDSIKKQTKRQETYTDTLESVAKTLPALMRAEKVGKRAMRAGMDFENVEQTVKSIDMELLEFKEAVAEGNSEKIEDEFGDLLFSCTNTARHLGIDAEEALTKATEKFIKRFKETENIIRLKGIDMKSLSIDELDTIWQKAKETLAKDC